MKKFVTLLIFILLSCIAANAQYTIQKVPSKNTEKCIAHSEELSIFVDGNNRYSLHISADDKAFVKLSMGNSIEECDRLMCNLYLELAKLVTGEKVVITDSVTKSKYEGEKCMAGWIEKEFLILKANNVFFRFKLINLYNLSHQITKARFGRS